MIKTQLEIWKEIKGFEGYYEISSYGRVRSVLRTIQTSKCDQVFQSVMLKPFKTGQKGNEYLGVGLRMNRSKTTKKVHRLVAKHFIPNPLNLPEVNHKDCDKNNNFKNNLEWATHQHNMEHAKVNGRMKGNGLSYAPRGANGRFIRNPT